MSGLFLLWNGNQPNSTDLKVVECVRQGGSNDVGVAPDIFSQLFERAATVVRVRREERANERGEIDYGRVVRVAEAGSTLPWVRGEAFDTNRRRSPVALVLLCAAIAAGAPWWWW
jgi:hypothetical protein